MLSVDEALGKIQDAIAPLPSEEIFLHDALGRVLAEDIVSAVSHPPQAVSAMDGYAVIADDVATAPATLTRVGEAAAGHPFTKKITRGTCARIFTGGAVPPGADTIVIQEDTEVAGNQITITEAATPGQWVRAEGLDFKRGTVLLARGRRLTARDIGLAAAAGATWVRVRRRPRVAILSTGDEVVMPGAPRRDDQIVSSNSISLLAYCRVFGAEAVSLGVAKDTRDDVQERLCEAKGFDLLVTSGGASVGDHDLVQSVSGEAGMELGFYKIAMRPGKPLIFGRMGETLLLGLPGNPVSTGVTSAIFLRAALDAMAGQPPRSLYRAAVLGADVKANGMRLDYMRADLRECDDALPVATPFARQDSSMMALFAQADCLIMRDIDAPPAQKGDTVKIIDLRMNVETF